MIRLATPDDVEPMLELGRRMHAESPVYAPHPFSDHMVRDFIHRAIADHMRYAAVAPMPAGRAAPLAGLMIGMIDVHFFGPTLIAQDQALYVAPEARGAGLAGAFLDHFADWARDAGAKVAVFATSAVPPRDRADDPLAHMCESRGYEQVGKSFQRRL